MFGRQKLKNNITHKTSARKIFAIFALAALLFVGQIPKAEAAIPKYINFQGKLTAVSNGNNVANGSYTFEFKLYTAVSGGSLLWTETWDGSPAECPQLAVAQGVFNAKLGSCNPLTGVDFTTGSLFLSVNFDDGGGFDGEMSPRKQLVSSAYAFVANGVSGDGVVNTANQSATALTVGRGATYPALQVDTNTASSETGIKVTAAAAAGGVAIAAISSGANEALTINSKGTGEISLGSSSTGNINIGSSGTGDILLGGGSASTGCTVTNSSGAFACSAGLTGVGVNASTGLLQGQLGLTVSGAAVSLNASSNFDVNIATGTSTGTINLGGTGAQSIQIGSGVGVKTITIGNAADDTFSLASSGLNVSTGGAITGASGIVSSGTIQFSSLTSNGPLYTSAGNGTLTTTAPTSGAIGYWSRTGTILSQTTANDTVSLSGNSGDILTVVSSATGAANKSINISQTGATAGTDYAGYFSNTGAATTNVGLYATATGATNNYAAIFEAGNVGIGTTGPDRKLDILDASNPQLRLTYTDGSVYSDLQSDSAGDFFMRTTGDDFYMLDNSIAAGAKFALSDSGNNEALLDLQVYRAGVYTSRFKVNQFGQVSMGTAGTTNGIDNVGVGTDADAKFEIGGNFSSNAWGLNGIQLQASAGTYTDANTAASGTATNAVFNSFAIPTLAATNTTVTTTNAATLYVAGAPTAGTNQTITNAYSLWVDAGRTRLDGDLQTNITGSTQCVTADTNGVLSGTGSTCGGTASLQASYNGGNSIETAANTAVVITETAAAANTGDLLQLTYNAATGGNNAGDALQITLDAVDASGTDGNGLRMIIDQTANTGNAILVETDGAVSLFQLDENGGLTLGAASAETTAITVTDTDYTNALSIGDNDITGTTFDLIGTTAVINFTNFDVDSAGSVTAVGVNAGAGLLQGQLGLTITGAAVNLNASSNFDVNIATGTSTGTINLGGTGAQSIQIGSGVGVKTITIGNAADDTFSLASSGLNVTSGGALTGVASIDTINVSSTALTFTSTAPTISVSTAATNISLEAGTTGQINIGSVSSGNVNIAAQGSGDILLGGGSASTGCTVTNSSGNFACTGALSGSNLSGSSSGTNTGDVTLAAIGASPNANGASLSGQALTLQPASASFGGVVDTTTQTFAGAKTFSDNLTATTQIQVGGTANNTARYVNGSFTSSTASLAGVYMDLTNNGSSGQNFGVFGKMTHTGTNSGDYGATGGYFSGVNNNVTTYGVRGTSTNVSNTGGSSSATFLWGDSISATNAGTVSSRFAGSDIDVFNTGTASGVTSGLRVTVRSHSGTMADRRGIDLTGWTSVVAPTNSYGIYADTSIDGGTNKYFIYSTATSSSYMAGNLGLGDTSPASLLTVGTGDLFQVNSSGDILTAAAENLSVTTGTTGILTLDTGTTGAINIGTGTAGKTISIGTDNTTKDTINIGSVLDDVAISSDSWSITNAGALTVVSCTGCGGGGGSLSSLTAATADDTDNDNLNYQIDWDWSTATTQNAFALNATGTGLTSGSIFKATTASTGAISNGAVQFAASGNYSGTGGLLNATATASTAGTLVNFTNNTATYTGNLLSMSLTGQTSGTGLSITGGGANMTAGGELIDLQMGAATVGSGLNITTSGVYTGAGIFQLTANSATTGVIQQVNANGLTSGNAIDVTSSAAANFTGALVDLNLSDGTGASSNTGSLLSLTNSGTANANTALYVKHYATGTGNLALRVDDVSGDTTPFVIDGTGAVGIGDSTPDYTLDVVGNIGVGTGAADGLIVSNVNAGDYISFESSSNSIDFFSASANYLTINGTAGSMYFNGANANIDFYFRGQSDNAMLYADSSANSIGIGTSGPDRKLDVLDASNPQIRLTQADGTVYGDLQSTTTANLIVTGDSLTGSVKEYGLRVAPTVNQSSAAGASYSALDINVTETGTSALNGLNRLADFRASDSSKLAIRNDGSLLLQNAANIVTPYGSLGSFQNHLVRSEAFDNASWIKTSVTAPTADTQTAPDGSTTAESLATSGSGGDVCQWSGTAAGSDTFTFSVWARSTSGTQNFDMRVDAGATSCATANNVTGTAVTHTATTSWQRFTVTQTFSAATGNVKARIFPGGTGGTGTIYAWGAQVDKDSKSNSYAFTTSAALTNVNRGETAVSNFATQSGFTYGGRHIVNLEGAISASSSLVGEFIRVIDNSTGTDDTATVRALEVQSYSGTNINGVNTAIAGFGYTFGVHAVTTAQANESAQPAAVFADLDNGSAPTQGNAIRAYSNNVTSSDLVVLYHESTTFSGNGLEMNFGNSGGGSFTGNFISLQTAGTESFHVDDDGSTFVSLTGATATDRLCWDGAGGSNEEIVDCTGTPGDLAENFGTSDASIAAGDVVVSSGEATPTMKDGHFTTKAYIAKSTGSYQTTLLGVVSTQPNEVYADDLFTEAENPRPVALVGRVPVKVTTENGAIKSGDYLTSSATQPGKAMKATSSGMVIGQALSSYDGTGDASVIVFVSTGYQSIGNTIVLDAPSTEGQILQSGNENLASNTASTFVIQQQTAEGNGDDAPVSNILQLQTGDSNRFMVSSSGATSILSSMTCELDSNECPSVLKVTQANTELMNIDARGTLTLAGTIFIKDDTFAGSVATDVDGLAEITFSYNLGTGKPVVQLTAEAQIPVFAQILEFKQDEQGNYTGFVIKTFDLISGPISATVHYNVTGKQEGYITLGVAQAPDESMYSNFGSGDGSDGTVAGDSDGGNGGDGVGLIIEGGQVVGGSGDSSSGGFDDTIETSSDNPADGESIP